MARLKVKWSELALKSLAEIHDYISNEAQSTTSADKLILKITERAELLTSFPFAGQAEAYLEDIHINGRYLVEGNYKIIYTIQQDCIEILDVFHTKQNPLKLRRSKKND